MSSFLALSALRIETCPEILSAPDIRLLSDELLHQLPALGVVKDDDLDSSLLQIRLTTNESLVLSDDHFPNLI